MDAFENSADILAVAFILGWAVGALIAQMKRSSSLVQAVLFSIGKTIAAVVSIAYLSLAILLLKGTGVIGWAVIGIAAGLIFAYMRHWPIASSDQD